MTISIVNSLPEDQWRHFVENHPEGNIFQTPEMFQVFNRTKGHKAELWAATKNGRLLALFIPVKITLMGGVLYYFTTRAVAYGSVLSSRDEEGKDALEKLLRSYTKEVKREGIFTEFRNLSDLSGLQPVFKKYDFEFEEFLNYLIDLNRPETEIWSKLQKKIRQQIRKARDSGVIIEEVTESQKLTTVYQLLEQVFTRARVPLASVTLFETAFDILVPQDMLKIIVARLGEHCIGAHIVLTYKERIFDWYVASDRAFSSYHAEPLMLWWLLQWGKEHKFRLFDFGGAGKPGEKYGVREFKAKFGGELVSFGRNVFVHSPLLFSLCKVGYGIWRFLTPGTNNKRDRNGPEANHSTGAEV
jgi:lipid II:glycine glycyltransferase (peptidoglycan interpeptide bridge formation enzyme)